MESGAGVDRAVEKTEAMKGEKRGSHLDPSKTR